MEILSYFLFFLSFLFFSKYFLSKKNKNLPPSPPSLPLIGHLHLFKKPLHRTLAKISEKYGQVLYLQFGSRPILVLSSPSAVEDCFTKNNDIVFANRPRLLIGKILGNDYTTLVWSAYGHNWRNLRRISTTEILSTHRVQTYTEMRLEEVKSMIRGLSGCGHEYQKVEMRTAFFELTLNMMMRMIAKKRYYGKDVEETEERKEFQELVRETLELSGASNVGDFLPLLRWIGMKGFEKRVLSVREKRDKYMQRLIEEKRRMGSGGAGKGRKKTLIEVLLSLQEKEPEYYTDEMIRGLAWNLFGAGTDTTAGAMEWAMSLLLNNPEVIKKAQEEIDLQVGQDRLLEEADINKLPYLHSIITETLRMYPPGPLLIPHASSEETTIGGYTIPSDTMLLVNLWAIQNDPNIWEDPRTFKPERFKSLKGNRDGFNYMPFGSGRRGCPGEGFAMHVVGITLGSLIQCFDWERVGEEMVDMREGGGLTLTKVIPLEAKCRPRSTASKFISQF